VLAVPVAFLFREAWKRLPIIAVVAFVLVVELLNTAIEKLATGSTLRSTPDRSGQGHGLSRGRSCAAHRCRCLAAGALPSGLG